MKKVLFSLTIIFSLYANSYSQGTWQDSILWPNNVIYLDDCNNYTKIVPEFTNGDYVTISSPEITKFYTNEPDSIWYRTLGVWHGLNWQTSELVTHISIFKCLEPLSENVPIHCKSALYLDTGLDNVDIPASDFIENPGNDILYTYDAYDKEDFLRNFDLSSPTNIPMTIFAPDSSSLCTTELVVRDCNLGFSFLEPSDTTIDLTGQEYVVLNAKDFEHLVVYECGDVNLSISIKKDEFRNKLLFDVKNVGMTYDAELKLNTALGGEYVKDFKITVIGEPKLNILNFENVSYQKDEVFEVEVWSEDIDTLASFQFSVRYPGLELLSVDAGLFEFISNINNEESCFKMSWYDKSGWCVNDIDDATWFTLRFRALSDGVTSDVLKLGNELPQEFTYCDEDDVSVWIGNVNFVPGMRTSASKDLSKDEVLVVIPNPASTEIRIGEEMQGYQYGILSMDGRVLSTSNIQESIDVSMLPKGMYLLRISTDNNTLLAKFVIAR